MTMKAHVEETTYHDAATGREVGAARRWLSKRFDFLGDILGVEARTFFTRQLRANAAKQERLDAARTRGMIAAQAIYSVMNAQGRSGDVPKPYRPGATEMPSFARTGIIDELLPEGVAVAIPANTPGGAVARANAPDFTPLSLNPGQAEAPLAHVTGTPAPQ